MLFDFAAVDTPLSDSLVLNHNTGWKRIAWSPSTPRYGPILRPRGTGTHTPKR